MIEKVEYTYAVSLLFCTAAAVMINFDQHDRKSGDANLFRIAPARH
jgi:hypothetical protein